MNEYYVLKKGDRYVYGIDLQSVTYTADLQKARVFETEDDAMSAIDGIAQFGIFKVVKVNVKLVPVATEEV